MLAVAGCGGEGREEPSPEDVDRMSATASVELEGRGAHATEKREPTAATGSPTPSATDEALKPPAYQEVENRDVDLPAVAKRIRVLVVQPGLPEQQLRVLLISYERQLRADVRGAQAPNKLIYVYVYDDVRKVKAGLGEWVGMIKSEALDGEPFGPADLRLRIPDPSVPVPTQRENQIYDYLQNELWRDPDVPEDKVLARVARHFGLSVEVLNAIFLKVFTYRHSGARHTPGRTILHASR